MYSPLEVPVKSITSDDGQSLILDGRDAERVRGKRVCLVEDVIATGGSVLAAEELLKKAGAQLTVISCVLLKGDMKDPRLIYLKRPAM
jgi:adenine phosphoribosyltransferase